MRPILKNKIYLYLTEFFAGMSVITGFCLFRAFRGGCCKECGDIVYRRPEENRYSRIGFDGAVHPRIRLRQIRTGAERQ